MDASFTLDEEMLVATGTVQQYWHERAATLTRGCFGKNIFVRGVVEVSNFCRENCSYCGMRRDNRSLARYRADLDILTELLLRHRPAILTDLNIQAGEDPVAVSQIVVPLIRTLRRETSLGISVCLGTLNETLYKDLQEAGAKLYIIKFETAEEELYARLQSPGSLAERLRHIHWLAANGWYVSSGFIAGLPDQSPSSLLLNLSAACELPLHGCSVSPFIPGEETPLADGVTCSADLALNCMAALRLMRPGLVIPTVSALNLAGKGDGYRRGLRAGGNLCTINLTPEQWRTDYLLYKRDRFIMTEEGIRNAIEAEGLGISKESLLTYLSRVSGTSAIPPSITVPTEG